MLHLDREVYPLELGLPEAHLPETQQKVGWCDKIYTKALYMVHFSHCDKVLVLLQREVHPCEMQQNVD